ncbi:hypothetical protein [Pelagibacterium sp. H642]|uniref:hypothetical protein n=1 Tax=Pelagibacterium sp. H642 TaxID=1881069 RepID=UPI00281604AE|nr:hypothetical protein [Pelagibacterium sp. H642]WMT89231.1 hypothetical protein NO934_10375 [Pelagibacterium sp. H642]
MISKPLAAALAFATSSLLSLGSAGFAQTVGGQEISEADWPIVENHCAELAGQPLDDPAEQGASGEATDTPADTDARADQGMPQEMLSEGTADEPAEENEDLATVDLDAITLEDCTDAGLVTEQ